MRIQNTSNCNKTAEAGQEFILFFACATNSFRKNNTWTSDNVFLSYGGILSRSFDVVNLTVVIVLRLQGGNGNTMGH